MDFKDSIGKYLRLREELSEAHGLAHRTRVIAEMKRLERWLEKAGLAPFADTRPLEDA